MKFKTDDPVQLKGTTMTGKVTAVDGDTVTVEWDDKTAGLSAKVAAEAIEAGKKNAGAAKNAAKNAAKKKGR